MKSNKSRLVSVILALVMVVSVCAFVGCSKEAEKDTGYRAAVEDYLKSVQESVQGVKHADDVAAKVEELNGINSASEAEITSWASAYDVTDAISVKYTEETKLNEKAVNYLNSTYDKEYGVKVTAAYQLKCDVTYGEVVRPFEIEVCKVDGKWCVTKVKDIAFDDTKVLVEEAKKAAEEAKKAEEEAKKAAEAAEASAESSSAEVA